MSKHKKIVTVEEHFVTGGLGSLIAEGIAESGLAAKLLRVGVYDAFPDRYTTHEENLRYIGLDAEGVAAKLKVFFTAPL
jgi:transketolase